GTARQPLSRLQCATVLADIKDAESRTSLACILGLGCWPEAALRSLTHGRDLFVSRLAQRHNSFCCLDKIVCRDLAFVVAECRKQCIRDNRRDLRTGEAVASRCNFRCIDRYLASAIRPQRGIEPRDPFGSRGKIDPPQFIESAFPQELRRQSRHVI